MRYGVLMTVIVETAVLWHVANKAALGQVFTYIHMYTHIYIHTYVHTYIP
jgi:hypothetical protein